jgi:hypothetical protein
VDTLGGTSCAGRETGAATEPWPPVFSEGEEVEGLADVGRVAVADV